MNGVPAARAPRSVISRPGRSSASISSVGSWNVITSWLRGASVAACASVARVASLVMYMLTPTDAIQRLNEALNAAGRSLGTEIISVFEAYGRILARDVVSPTPLPEFRRSTVDGYAVRAMSVPGVLRVIGEIKMGELSNLTVRVGEAVQIPTGGFVPEGADAVVMVEQTRLATTDDRPPSSDENATVVGRRSSVVSSRIQVNTAL